VTAMANKERDERITRPIVAAVEADPASDDETEIDAIQKK
jgi:hypothetical protein